jgi:protein TonB
MNRNTTRLCVAAAFTMGLLLASSGAPGAQVQGERRDEAALRALAERQPTEARLYLQLAELYIDQGRLDEAVEMITNALALTRQQAQSARLDPPEPSSSDEPLRVGTETILAPREVHYVEPEYPAIARTARISGVVILDALIDPQGHVVDTTVLRSVNMLDQAAVDAVSQWRFTPTLLNGRPTSVLMRVEVPFSPR